MTGIPRAVAPAVVLALVSAAVAPGAARPELEAAALEHFYNLDYDQATKEFRDLTAAEPDSAEAWNHLAQDLFYSSMFDCGLMGSDFVKSNDAIIHGAKVVMPPEREAEMQNALTHAESIAQNSLKSNPRDASALYELGNSYALRANYQLLAKHAWLSGFKLANESRKLHEQVMKIDPANYDAKLRPGTHEYMVGTLPMAVRWMARMAGESGNRAEGLKKVEQVAAHGNRVKVDAQILLCVLYRREDRSANGAPLLRQLSEQFPRNFLFRTELAKVYLDMGDKPRALAEMDRIEKLIADGAPGYTGGRVAIIHRQTTEVAAELGQSRNSASVALASVR
jgi:tetratricopeptide (TPR) repeat protein